MQILIFNRIVGICFIYTLEFYSGHRSPRLLKSVKDPTSKGQCLRMTWDGGRGEGGELIPPHNSRKVPFRGSPVLFSRQEIP